MFYLCKQLHLTEDGRKLNDIFCKPCGKIYPKHMVYCFAKRLNGEYYLIPRLKKGARKKRAYSDAYYERNREMILEKVRARYYRRKAIQIGLANSNNDNNSSTAKAPEILVTV